MNSEGTVGWDLGGAHLKVVWLDSAGRALDAAQFASPLWLGIEELRKALRIALDRRPISACQHAVTMTGELADIFGTREAGVAALVRTLQEALPAFHIYAGENGFGVPDDFASERVASANWHASASYVAGRLASALLIDIGSTTTDITIIDAGKLHSRGAGDHQRLMYDELVYTGVARTPLIAMAEAAPFRGEWVRLMAEHFATAADVYRLMEQLPAEADQTETADRRGKSAEESAARLARMLGLDSHVAPLKEWRRVAEWFSEQQLSRIYAALCRALSRGLLGPEAPLVGAGAGSFLAEKLAQRMSRPYLDFADLVEARGAERSMLSTCAPAFSVAWLLQRQDR